MSKRNEPRAPASGAHEPRRCAQQQFTVAIVMASLVLLTNARLAEAQSSSDSTKLYLDAMRLYENRPFSWGDPVALPLQQFLFNPTIAPSPEVRMLMERYRPAFDRLERGMSGDPIDLHAALGDPQQGGLDALANRRDAYSSLQTMARLIEADATLKLYDGDSAGAARRLGAAYAASSQLAGDGMLISSLVGMAQFGLADRVVMEGVQRGILRLEDVQFLHRTLEGRDEVDPYGMQRALVANERLIHEAAMGIGENADGLQRFKDALLYSGGVSPEAEETLKAMDSSAIEHDLNGFDAMSGAFAALLANPDDDAITAATDDLEQRAAAGEFGEIAKVTGPLYARHARQHVFARNALNDRRAMLEAIATGEQPLSDFINAAQFYLAAAKQLDALDDETMVRLRSDGDQSRHSPDDAVKQLLSETQPMVDLVREGSQKTYCNFEPYRPLNRAMIAPPYAGAMHDLVRLLDLHTQHLAASGNRAALASHLDMTIRFAAHLSMDGQVMSSAIAHDAVVRILPAMEPNAAASWSDEERALLAAAVATLPRADPFGYGNAASSLSPVLSSFLPREPQSMYLEHSATLRANVDSWSADRRLMLTAVMERAFIEDVVPHTENGLDPVWHRYVTDPDDLMRLTEFVDANALDDARDMMPQVVSMIGAADFEGIAQLEVPLILDVAGRMAKARRDLARALRAVGNFDDE